MTGMFPLISFLPHALLQAYGGDTHPLTTVKSVLTTVLLAIAVSQALEQALLYRWIRVKNLNRRLVLRLHRLGGAAAVLLIFVVLGLCWYTWLGLDYPLGGARVVAHAVLGGLATIVLLTKVAIANRFHQFMSWTLPLGVSAGLLLLGIFLLTALPYFLGLL